LPFASITVTNFRKDFHLRVDAHAGRTGITLRVREDLDVEHLADIIGALARRGRGC
jgi:hypothetical protein